MRLAVFGAAGRMGGAVLRLMTEHGMTLVGAADSAGGPAIGRDAGLVAGIGEIGVAISEDVRGAAISADCAIDFTRPDALPAIVQACIAEKVALVTGTTGLDARAEAALEKAAAVVPVLASPNMSLGVHVLAMLTEQAVRSLGPGFDVEIVEIHHKKKADAPSGTAKRLLEAVLEARPGAEAITGRDGIVGPRKASEVGVLAVRGGDVIGDHSVHLLGDGERLELVHRATNRDVFARGALVAAKWLAKKPAGRYIMRDVLADLVSRPS